MMGLCGLGVSVLCGTWAFCEAKAHGLSNAFERQVKKKLIAGPKEMIRITE
jgi:hypothetical protein